MTWSPRNGRNDSDDDDDDNDISLDTSNELKSTSTTATTGDLKNISSDIEISPKKEKLWSLDSIMRPESTVSNNSNKDDEKVINTSTNSQQTPQPTQQGNAGLNNGMNPLMMAAAMNMNKMIPPHLYAMMQQQQVLQQQQQLAAMMRLNNGQNFNPMFLNGLFGMNLPGASSSGSSLRISETPSTSTSPNLDVKDNNSSSGEYFDGLKLIP